MIRGKNIKMTVMDVSEGYTVVNPIMLKSLDDDTIKEFYLALHKAQTDIRVEKFPFHNPQALRVRNMKLQRLNTAASVVKTYARPRKIFLL